MCHRDQQQQMINYCKKNKTGEEEGELVKLFPHYISEQKERFSSRTNSSLGSTLTS